MVLRKPMKMRMDGLIVWKLEIINVTMKMHKNMLSEYEIDHPEEDIKFGSDEMENEKVDLKM